MGRGGKFGFRGALLLLTFYHVFRALLGPDYTVLLSPNNNLYYWSMKSESKALLVSAFQGECRSEPPFKNIYSGFVNEFPDFYFVTQHLLIQLLATSRKAELDLQTVKMFLDIPANATATIRAMGSAVATITTTPEPFNPNLYRGKIPPWLIVLLILVGITGCMGTFFVYSFRKDSKRYRRQEAERAAAAMQIDLVEPFENFDRVMRLAVRDSIFGDFQPARLTQSRQPQRPRPKT